MRMDLERCYSSLCTRTHNKEGGVSYRRDQPFIRYFKSWNLYGIKVPTFRSDGTLTGATDSVDVDAQFESSSVTDSDLTER